MVALSAVIVEIAVVVLVTKLAVFSFPGNESLV
jgi:hypothetical protein